eukprot:2362260-Prorocentrum_lima.AAC.1
MTSSLVGSEMCIRDRKSSAILSKHVAYAQPQHPRKECSSSMLMHWRKNCLLYTSDAADDM